jgi:hypothetical protein
MSPEAKTEIGGDNLVYGIWGRKDLFHPFMVLLIPAYANFARSCVVEEVASRCILLIIHIKYSTSVGSNCLSGICLGFDPF